MALLPEIDTSKTKMNARKVLAQYRKWERIAGKAAIDIKSPLLSDMPKNYRYGNKTEDAVLQFIEAEGERDAILAALMALKLVSRQTLYYSFCSTEDYKNYQIADKVHIPLRSLERAKSEALIEFAEAYKKGKLICYQ